MTVVRCCVMTRIRIVLSLLLLDISQEVFAAPREKVVAPFIRPLAVSAKTKAEMARCSLRAYENCDPTNVVQALLFTPKPVGMNPLPMVVYIPGNGEIGDIARQFRQRAIFDRVTSAAFQEKYPMIPGPRRGAKTRRGTGCSRSR